MRIQVKVNGPRGEEKIIDLCDNEEQMKRITVLQLKKKSIEEMHLDGDLRIVYRTEPLEEESLLVSYGIRHMSIVHVLLKLPGGI